MTDFGEKNKNLDFKRKKTLFSLKWHNCLKKAYFSLNKLTPKEVCVLFYWVYN
jgi:hypothetical protein